MFPNNISILNNRTHNNFIETQQHIVVKVLNTFTDKTQSVIGSRNSFTGVTMEIQIWVNPNTQVFLFIS